jgi:protein involved in polysaccharide export with SLBB domain
MMLGKRLADGPMLLIRRCLRTAFFFAPLLSGVILLPVISHAQNPSPEQLLQLQQQLGQREGAVPPLDMAPQPNVVLQPESSQRPPLPPSRLEQIMSTRAGATLQQFGYDQFGVGRSVTLSQTGAVQDNYVLGAGDEISISLRGAESTELRRIVDRNGQILLPRLAPISATGRTLGSFRQDVEAAIARAYVATNAFVSVGRVRQISVLVSGEVNNPGQRLLTGLSSVVDAILLSGGVRKSGSLRNVRVQRGGREFTIDLYSVLTARGNSSTMRLADGDRILVPLLGQTVAVSGLVRQPGIFELPPRQSSISVANLLQLVGGQEIRGLFRYNVLRIEADGRSNLVSVNEQRDVIRESEILFVQMGADQVVNRATLSGGMGLAGTYAVRPGMSLSEMLRAPGGLGTNPYSLFGLIVRQDRQSLLRVLVPFTPVAVINGREDIRFESGDFVKVFSLNEARMLGHVMQSYLQRLATEDAAMRDPLRQSTPLMQSSQTQENSQLLSAVNSYITNVSPEVQRRTIISLYDTPEPGSPLAQARQEQTRREALDLELARGTVQAQPAGIAAAQGAGQPAVRPAMPPPSSQSLQQNSNLSLLERNDPARSFIDLERNFIGTENSPGGYVSNRDAQTFGQLVRQLDIDALVLINFLVEHRARLEGAVRGSGDYLIGPNVSLADMVQAAGGVVNWADESGVELITTTLDRSSGRSSTQRETLPLRTGTLASYIVRPRDQFRFAQIFSNVGVGSVTVQGEVRNPGTFSILRGDRLSDVLTRAGGLTSTAYPSGTVFLRESVARLERESYLRAAREVEEQMVVAMTRSRMEPNTFSAMQVFVQEIRNQKPVGRVSIVADPSTLAARPEIDPLLEADDIIYIPQRPGTIAVLGQVMQPGSYPFVGNEDIGDYIAKAGGLTRAADTSQTYIVLPDGSARKIERSWFRYSQTALPPGSTIVIPRDIAPFDLRQTVIDVTQILSQLAVSIASVAVISKQ